MSVTWLPTTQQVKETFVDELREIGGHVSDSFDDGRRLFLRSVLRRVKQVRAGDGLQAGVALRAAGPEIWVHPYVFHQVCRNGAIFATALESRRIERVEGPEYSEAPELLFELVEAVRLCSSEDVFEANAGRMRSAAEVEADLLMTMPTLAQLPEQVAARILERFGTERDRSQYGLMNAVTSVARDTHDPEMRWRLEELGGGVAARVSPAPVLDIAAALRT
jgi:hypothetical protein